MVVDVLLVGAHMKRRTFISGITFGFLAAPLAAEAQSSGTAHRIGFLAGGSPGPSAPSLEQFRQGLRDLGYIEGQNIVIEYRWAEGKLDRLPELAADLVRLKVDLIVAPVSNAAQAAHQAFSAARPRGVRQTRRRGDPPDPPHGASQDADVLQRRAGLDFKLRRA